jgi:hypothetical protein
MAHGVHSKRNLRVHFLPGEVQSEEHEKERSSCVDTHLVMMNR